MLFGSMNRYYTDLRNLDRSWLIGITFVDLALVELSLVLCDGDSRVAPPCVILVRDCDFDCDCLGLTVLAL